MLYLVYFQLQGFAEKYQNIVTPVAKQDTGLKAFLKNISSKNNQTAGMC